MLDAHAEAQVRAGALNHAMHTATPGEDVTAILIRATLYADFVLRPFQIGAASHRMGAPETKAIN